MAINHTTTILELRWRPTNKRDCTVFIHSLFVLHVGDVSWIVGDVQNEFVFLDREGREGCLGTNLRFTCALLLPPYDPKVIIVILELF